MPPSPSIPQRRLAGQLVTNPVASLVEAVAWLGAVQAQDYGLSPWALGLRSQGATAAMVDRAVADGSIVRTHAFRGTWQYIARDDARWMLALVADRVVKGSAARYRAMGLDERTLRRAEDVLRDATGGGAQLTRAEIAAALQRARIATDGHRLSHIIGRAELDAVICSGGRRGKQPTYAAFDERVPQAAARSRDSAFAELARRFFRSRGPATMRDFLWWTGLAAAEVRAGHAAIAGELACADVDGATYWWHRDAARGRSRTASIAHLLPAFDEYLIGYSDRCDVLHPDHVRAINNGGGFLAAIVVVDGHVAGTWSRSFERAGLTIDLAPLRAWKRAARAAITEAAERYAAFVASPLAAIRMSRAH